ncbi:MAG: Flp family type IVb pilin [Planctomycetota bacterium]|nr:MAG: Flp family type IVb pilin [Planctomycetota bacterium]
MWTILRKLRKDSRGATAIEYGLIAALVAIAAIGALTALGGNLKGVFNTVNTELDAAGGGAGTG